MKREDVDTRLIAKVLQARTEVLNQIPEQVDFIDCLPEYDTALYIHKKMKTNKETSLEALKAALPVLEALDDFSEESIHTALFDLIAKLGVKNGYLLWPIRVAVSGKQFTPGGGIEICSILGKKESLARIRKGIDLLRQISVVSFFAKEIQKAKKPGFTSKSICKAGLFVWPKKIG